MLGQRLRDGQPRHVRQGRPGRARRRRPADAAGEVADGRRHRGMSVTDTTAELQAVADRVVEQARAGEQIEAFVVARRRDGGPGVRGRRRALRVGAGRGHRHPRDQGRSHRVRLRGHARRGGGPRGARRGAGQRRVRHGRRVGRARRARWRASPPSSRCGTTRSPTFPTDRKIDIAKELEKLASRPRPTRARRRLELRRRVGRGGRRVDRRASGSRVARTAATCRCRRSPTTAKATTPRRRPASASPSGSRPTSSTSTVPPARRSIGRRDCWAPRSRRRSG